MLDVRPDLARLTVKPSRPRVNRRDLLRLRKAARALREPSGAEMGRVEERSVSSADLLRASRPAMGSYFEVRLGANVPGAADLAGRALDLIEALEFQMTVYRDDSEVSRLNASAHLGPVAVEAGLFGLLRRAAEIGDETGGAYDVTAGALSVAWGFFKGPKRIPDPETLADARARTGQHHLRLGPERSTVAFDRPGVVINLGSIGKGYAIDRAVGLIREHWWPTSAVVHGGRSSLYALGSPPGRFGGRWDVALRNPFRPDTPLGMFRLRNRGLGTSGTDFQRFEAGGRVFGHILDPRTGEPALGPAGVTVLAPTAADADALSTAFYLLGPEAAAEHVAKHPGVAAVFVEEGDADGSPRVTTFGLSAHDFEPSTG
jgi:thiamine biosynthesis lipoprotein